MLTSGCEDQLQNSDQLPKMFEWLLVDKYERI